MSIAELSLSSFDLQIHDLHKEQLEKITHGDPHGGLSISACKNKNRLLERTILAIMLNVFSHELLITAKFCIVSGQIFIDNSEGQNASGFSIKNQLFMDT